MTDLRVQVFELREPGFLAGIWYDESITKAV